MRGRSDGAVQFAVAGLAASPGLATGQKGLPRAAFSSRQWPQQLDNAIVVRSERELVQGSAAERVES